METKQIMLALTLGDSPALGNIWRITAKKTDFYLDPLDEAGAVGHLSVHGPNEQFDGHRFHMKVDRQLAATAKDRNLFVMHTVPRKGYFFDGKQLAAHAFLVARIRWTWDLQRSRFRAAAISASAPELADHQLGARMAKALSPNDAWDIDLVISYDQPYWPDSPGSLRDHARLGPLPNEAGLWLTATSYHRSQKKCPSPKQLCPPLPRASEAPNRIMCSGPGSDVASDMFWFVETITSRQFIDSMLPTSRKLAQARPSY